MKRILLYLILHFVIIVPSMAHNRPASIITMENKCPNIDSIYESSKKDLQVGDFHNAKQNLCKYIDLFKSQYGEDSYEYASMLLLWISREIIEDSIPAASKNLSNVLSILERNKGRNIKRYIEALSTQADIDGLLQNAERSLSTLNYCLGVIDSLNIKKDELYVELESTKALILSMLGKPEEAQDNAIEALNYSFKLGDKYVYDQILCLNNCGYVSIFSGKYDIGLEYVYKALDLYKRSYKIKTYLYANILNNIAQCSNALAKYDDALKYGEEAIANFANTLGEKSTMYALGTTNLAQYNTSIGDYQKAEEWINVGCSTYKSIYGETSIQYATSLGVYALLCYRIGDYQKAITIQTSVVDITKRQFGENNPRYLSAINNLLLYYREIGNYAEARVLVEKIIGLSKSIYGEKNYEYLINLSNLALCYNDWGDYEKCIEISKSVLNGLDSLSFHYDLFYATVLGNIASSYMDLENYAQSVEYSEKSIEIFKREKGTENTEYAQQINNIALCYNNMHEYEKAKKHLMSSADFYMRKFGKYDARYAWTLQNMASLYTSMNMPDSALSCTQEALEIYDSLKIHNENYLTTLNNLASAYDDLNEYDKAEKIYEDLMYKVADTYGYYHPFMATVLSNAGSCVYSMHDIKNAIELEKKSAEVYAKTLGKNSINYASSLITQARYYYESGLNDRIVDTLMTESFDVKRQNLKENLSLFSDTQRQKYWDSEQYVFAWYPFFTSELNTNVEATYNVALLSKGLLLSSATNFAKVILDSEDSTLIDSYHMLLSLYKQKSSSKTMLKDEETISKDIESLERTLIHTSKKYGEFSDITNTNWTDIRRSLGENDVALEFVDVKFADIHNILALIVKNDSKTPIVVKLPVNDSISLKEWASYTTIWEPIIRNGKIKDGNNIYFSPDGILYQLGIEYLPIENGLYMADKYHMYRVSSTRALCERTQNRKVKSAVLYGGLKYDTDVDVMEKDSKSYNGINRGGDDIEAFINNKSGSTRFSLVDLPETLTEVDSIERILSNTMSVLKRTKDKGNEESFKDLSGKAPQLIHIATHGFYFNKTIEEQEYQDKNSSNIPSKSYKDPELSDVIDYSMERTGLVMSGAVNRLTGVKLPKGVDDGLLTSREISQLDLSNVDLAVLSACDTGMGDITSDGVAGLQRGFKNAGVKTLLMSLWKVDDSATQLLMVEFYRNLILGCSKSEALNKAQRFVRTYTQDGEQIFSDPKYWAAFILLDGLN